MKRTRNDAGLGFERGVSGKMQCDLPVKGGLRLKYGQEDFGKPPKCVKTSVWELGFQMGGQRVSMEQGGLSVCHRLRYRPLCCLIASWTPFPSKCHVL
ncbi:hypothetical protein ACI3L1_19735, partial [Deinococcus sp. SM5_A1]|uniref:hypothetical protein n=1 Tax=Deinococcus sp. SM5_A1 TaxID=3379094 RepID=UPI0038587435